MKMTENIQQKKIPTFFPATTAQQESVFTVPPGGDGVYYFSTYLLVQTGEWGHFEIRLNDNVICTAFGDQDNDGVDFAQCGCGAVISVVEGKSECNYAGSREFCVLAQSYHC